MVGAEIPNMSANVSKKNPHLSMYTKGFYIPLNKVIFMYLVIHQTSGEGRVVERNCLLTLKVCGFH